MRRPSLDSPGPLSPVQAGGVGFRRRPRAALARLVSAPAGQMDEQQKTGTGSGSAAATAAVTTGYGYGYGYM